MQSLCMQMMGSTPRPFITIDVFQIPQQKGNESRYRNNHDLNALAMDNQLMNPFKMQVDTNSYTHFVLKCIDSRSLEDGRRVHQHMIDSGFELGIILSNHLINMYAKCGCVENARQVFERMLEWNLVSWNIMIAGYSKNGYYEEAMDLFGLMHRTGVKPGEFTLASILGVCVILGVVDQGRELHAHIAKT